MVLGVVLPDFTKNAQKDYNLYPLKIMHLFESDPLQASILQGWKKHIAVDQIFHSSEFFKAHTNELKQLILPSCENSPVKPFFLAHIGLELTLDHLLVSEGLVNINTFYDQLSGANKTALNSFLQTSSLEDTAVFFKFLNSFIASRYLFSYQKMENISYALNRICMRLWHNPFTEAQLDALTVQLEQFKNNIRKDYMSIFNDIEKSISNSR